MCEIDRTRRFNRTVTRRIGALDARFLGRGRSLGASRVLFEIGEAGVELRVLRVRLGLDSGYASRLVQGLEAQGLVRTGPAPDDRRVRFASLTRAGRAELGALNRLSDEAAAALLAPLEERQRAELTAAMATVEKLLRSAAVRLAVEKPTARDARACLARYFEELAERFDGGFDPALGLPVDAADLVPPAGYFVVARLEGEAVGCAGMRCHPTFGEVKLMWVAGSARGLGIGRRLLGELARLARGRALPALRLETNRSLREAQALYRSTGFTEIAPYNDEPYAHHWFEKRLDAGEEAT